MTDGYLNIEGISQAWDFGSSSPDRMNLRMWYNDSNVLQAGQAPPPFLRVSKASIRPGLLSCRLSASLVRIHQMERLCWAEPDRSLWMYMQAQISSNTAIARPQSMLGTRSPAQSFNPDTTTGLPCICSGADRCVPPAIALRYFDPSRYITSRLQIFWSSFLFPGC